MSKAASSRRPSKSAPAPSLLGAVVRRFMGLFEQELPVTEFRGRGKFDTDVAGTKNWQHELEEICGGRTARAQKFPVSALLRPDREGLTFRVLVDGREVGQLKPKDARFVAKQLNDAGIDECALKVPALIVGGRQKRGGVCDDFLVKLCLPPRPEKQDKAKNPEPEGKRARSAKSPEPES